MAAARLRVVEVFWTDPDAALVQRARQAGPALVAWQVGSLDGALAAADAGCDFVIVQGVEAGGHVRGTTPREELLALVILVGGRRAGEFPGLLTRAEARYWPHG